MHRPHLYYIHLLEETSWLHMRREGRRVAVTNAASLSGWFLASRDYRGAFTLVRPTSAPAWW